MSDAITSDVSRQFLELRDQLKEDGFDVETPIGKTARRLQKALKEDGVDFTVAAASPEPDKDKKAVKTTKSSPVAETLPEEESDTLIRAFRTKNEYDTQVIESVFAAIDGWKTKVIEHKGSHFVVATNAPRLTEKRVKTAIHRYVTDLKKSVASV